MRSFTRTALLVGAAIALSAPGLDAQANPQAAGDNAKAELAKRILIITKSADMFMQGVTASLPAQRMASPQIPAAFWDTVMVRIEEQADSLLTLLTPVYTETFSTEELRGLLDFYESPLGQRMIELQPIVVSKSMAIGQRWGANIGMTVAQEFMQAGRMKPDTD